METRMRFMVSGILVTVMMMILSVSASDGEFSQCQCDDDGGWWSIGMILECERVSDFLIAVAYFSIPLEMLYFVSCSNVPFKWVLLQFIAFIVLCGLTHLLNAWTYNGRQSFQLMMSLTIAKVLTALVSCATAITLISLIPIVLKFKVRELFLRQNVMELGQEVGMMKKQKEAGLHVRMLTQEIRKSVDKHTILYTTLVELSKILDLQNCAVWMPNGNRTEMNLTHQLSPGPNQECNRALPMNDQDVLEITENKGVRFLRQDSVLGSASCGGSGEPSAVAAIRMPILLGSNFKGGTPQVIDTGFAILVLVLRSGNDSVWSYSEMEIVEVVADQVAVALSHASVLEESQWMREKLEERNRLLQKARENAVMASEARNSFQKVMSNGMRRPMHSIMGLLSVCQDGNLSSEQRVVIETIVKTSNVLSTLINDAMEISDKDEGRFPLEVKPFKLHSMVREASCLVKCLCVFKDFGYSADISSVLPNQVMGDEKRAFQVLLHMVGHLLNVNDGRASVTFRAVSESGVQEKADRWDTRRASSSDECVSVKFEIEVNAEGSQSENSIATTHFGGTRHNNKEVKEGLSFSMCRKLVQMMQGNIWMSSDSKGQAHSMTLLLRFQKQSSFRRHLYDLGSNAEQSMPSYMFTGLDVILADDDGTNRMVTKKLLEKLGCNVTAVSSGFQCLSTLGPLAATVRVVFLDLHMPEMDGFEVAMRIRKFRSRSWPLIIALTASAEDNVLERCLQAGMNGLIRKPVLLQGLADELRRVLQRAGDSL